jgi:rifampicin phosphotransferase
MSAQAAVPPVVPPPGHWRRADTHYPRPLSPFGASLLLPAANEGFRHMCEEFGLLAETVEEREIGGWVYLRVVPLGGKDRSPPPAWLLGVLLRLMPTARRRVRACIDAARTDRAGRATERWHAEWKPGLQDRLATLRDAEPAAMSDRELVAHVDAVRELVGHSQRIHMLLNQALNLLLAEFAFTARDLLGWREDRAFELVVGLSSMSSAPARAIARMTGIARRHAAVTDLLDRGADPEAVLASEPTFAAAFGEFQRWYGMRTIDYDAADPTLAERPDVVLSQVRDQVHAGGRPGADETTLRARRRREVEEARRVLATRAPEDGARFERALRRARLAYPVREEHGFLDTMMPLALARYAALELGARLAARGQLDDPLDVFFLDVGEARRALVSGAPQRRRAADRKRERAETLLRPPPATYGEALPPPSLEALPEEVRLVHEAVQWSYDRVFEPSASGRRQDRGDLLRGTGASPGRFTGPVRVVRDPAGFDRIRDGDILVCPTTSPVWSVLFPRLGALVTDTGGMLAHCAIIAREFGIPAVVATGNATQLLRDGQTATVDGAAGTVSVHSNEGDQPCHASSSVTR